MNYTLESLMKELNVEIIPEQFHDIFDDVMADFDAEKIIYLSESYLRELQEKYDVFPKKFDYILYAAEQIRKNAALARYTALLERVLRNNNRKGIIRFEDHPKTDEGDRNGLYGMTVFFAHASFIPESVEYFRDRNVPENIIRDTLLNLEDALVMHRQGFACDGFEVNRHFGWNQHFVICDILLVRRLNFEMRTFTNSVKVFKNNKTGEYKILLFDCLIHPSGYLVGSAGYNDEEGALTAELLETDEYYEGYPADTENAKAIREKVRLCKSEWSVALEPGDEVVNVHIPDMPDFSPEAVEYSYRRFQEVVKISFPEFRYKAFACGSWLLDPQLRDMLKKDSNILSFQSKYMRFPIKSQGKAVFTFLFKNQLIKRIEDQTENTSLERAAKRHYLEGKYIYEPAGVFFPEQYQ
ncbi:MAG: DUF5596 domain-containing protein [Clostridiales bacterium]|nr:DUF5596 domain-containing protein [Clostridiales bacterium]